MTEIVVYCGNGGDYEYYQHLAYWAIWIQQNVNGCSFRKNFNIRPHVEADKCFIIFDNEEDAVIFNLKRNGDYIMWSNIDWHGPNVSIPSVFG